MDTSRSQVVTTRAYDHTITINGGNGPRDLRANLKRKGNQISEGKISFVRGLKSLGWYLQPMPGATRVRGPLPNS